MRSAARRLAVGCLLAFSGATRRTPAPPAPATGGAHSLPQLLEELHLQRLLPVLRGHTERTLLDLLRLSGKKAFLQHLKSLGVTHTKERSLLWARISAHDAHRDGPPHGHARPKTKPGPVSYTHLTLPTKA